MSDIPPAPPTTQDILAVVNAATVDEKLRLITERPALLWTDAADAVLQQLLEHYANDPHTTRILAQTQTLLSRCREVGLAVVRAEMTGPQPSNALAIPPQFRLLFEQAQAALQRYHADNHDLAALDAAMWAWDAILYNPTFAHAPGTFRLAVLHDVSIALHHRFTARGNLSDLTWAIELLQAVVAATPVDAPHGPHYRNTLGTLLRQRYLRTGALADLDTAITQTQAALDATLARPHAHENLADYRTNLSSYLSDRYTQKRDAADLNRAVELAQAAVDLTPAHHPRWHGYRSNLAVRLHERSNHTHALADLDEAIRIAEAVVQATPDTSPDWPGRCTNLGIYLSDRSERTGNPDDRAAAITHYQHALAAGEGTCPDTRRRAANNLGRLFYVQGHYAEARAAFEQAHAAEQQVASFAHAHAALMHLVFCDIHLDATVLDGAAPPSPATLDAILDVMAASTWMAWQRIITACQAVLLTDQADGVLTLIGQRAAQEQHPHLVQSVEQRRTLLQRCRDIGIVAACAEVAGPQQPIALTIPPQFGSAFEKVQAARQRYQHHNHDLAALDAALEAWETILNDPTFAAAPDVFRLAVFHDVSITLNDRFTARGNLDDLSQAIDLVQQAVDATPAEAPHGPQYRNTLGTLLRQRYLRTGALADLDTAITQTQAALDVATIHPDAPGTLAGYRTNLSSYLSDRYTQKRDAADLNRAVDLARAAVEATPEDTAPWLLYCSNLAARLHQRSIPTDSPADRDEAIRIAETVVQATPDTSPDWPGRCTNLGIYLSDRSERTGNRDDRAAAIAFYQRALAACGVTLPVIRRRAATNLGGLFYVQGHYAEARTAFEQAHAAIQQLASFTQSHAARRQLSQENAQLYAHLVCCCLQLGDTAAAFTYAAAGKGRAFVDVLAADRFDLTAVGVDQPELLADLARVRELRTRIDTILKHLPTDDDDGREAATLSAQAPTLALHDLARLEAAHQERLQVITSRYPQLTATAHVPDLQPPAAVALAAALDATLVEFFQHTQGWCTFVITAAGVQHVALPGLTEAMLRKVQDWIAGFSSPWKYCYHDYARSQLADLHTAIFAPLATHLPCGGRVVLAPAGPLHQVPLGVALDRDAGSYACDTYLLSVVPSVGALAVAHAAQQQQRERPSPPPTTPPPTTSPGAPGQALVVMHPGDQHRADYLAVLQPAAEQIATCFAHSDVLYEQHALPGRVIRAASDCVVLHFFCHGRHDPKNALASGLYLEQGMLSVQQVLTEMQLHQTRLVSLGACVSACLQIVDGEEHVGLPWALLTARAQAVVGSLWPVHAGATVFLFHVFYQQVAAGLSPAAALQAAMHALRQHPEWAPPYYWAAFQVIGLALEGDIPLAPAATGTHPPLVRETQHLLLGGSMDAETFVKTTARIVRIMAEDDYALVQAALQDDPSARAALAALVPCAEQVQNDADLLALAQRIYHFVKDCPRLSAQYLMPGTRLFDEETVSGADQQSQAFVHQFAPDFGNHLRLLATRVGAPHPEHDPAVSPTQPADATAGEGQSTP